MSFFFYVAFNVQIARKKHINFIKTKRFCATKRTQNPREAKEQKESIWKSYLIRVCDMSECVCSSKFIV